MNKKLLVTAIAAGLMLPGLAAADVKLSGVIQAESGDIDVDTQGPGGDLDVTKQGDGQGAIWGGGNNQVNISGSEKLGNGLTAYFKIGSNFNTFDSGSNFGARDSFVGVKGDGWNVQFGEMNSRYKLSSVKYDPFVTTGLQSRATGAVSGMHNGYATDAGEIGFKSGGFSGGFQVSWEDSTNNNDCAVGLVKKGVSAAGCSDAVGGGSWSGNVMYGANGWEVGVAAFDLDYGGNAGDSDGWKIHGKWSGNGFSVMAQYEDIDADRKAAGAAPRADGGDTALNAQVNAIVNPASAANAIVMDHYDSLHIAATYAISDNTKLIGKYATADTESVNNGQEVDSDHWAIGVTHNLSKRTFVYGGYMDNSYDVDKGGADVDVDAWALGLMHSF